MLKHNYFELINTLASLACDSVIFACTDFSSKNKASHTDLRVQTDSILFSIESALLVEFVPPLKRESISAYAHSLHHLADTAQTHMTISSAFGKMRKRTEEEKLCAELATKIKENTALLKNIKKSSTTPDIQSFRDLMLLAVDAHSSDLARLTSGYLPKSYSQIVNSAGALRAELSITFNSLIDLILSNI